MTQRRTFFILISLLLATLTVSAHLATPKTRSSRTRDQGCTRSNEWDGIPAARHFNQT